MGRTTKTQAQGASGFAEKVLKYFPLIVFAVALAARLLVLWQLAHNFPGFDEPSVDSRWHLLWARQIVAGDWLGHSVFYRAPLYPYALAGLIHLLGDKIWLLKAAQAVFGSVTAILVFLLGRRVFTPWIGAGASLIWALWPTAIYYESEFFISVLILPLNLWALYRLAGSAKQGRLSPRSALVTGLILGASAIARPNILIFVAALAIWVFWRFARSRETRLGLWLPMGALLAGVFLPVSVVAVRNAVVGGDFVLIAYQGGVNLYLGNNPQAEGLTMMMPDIRLDESIDWTEFVRTTDSLACAQAGRLLKPSEISSFWTQKTIDSALAHPGKTLALLGKKFFYFWSGFENGDNTDLYRHADYSKLLRVTLWHKVIWFPFGVISAFGLWGMWIARRTGRQVELLNLFVWVYMLSVIGFLVTARHRLPVVPIVAIFAVAGMADLARRFRARGPLLNKLPHALPVVVLLVVINLTVFDVGLSNPIQYSYEQGLVWDRKGNYSRAIEAYQRALALWPNHFPSRRNLAYDFYRLGDYESAIQNFTWALGARPTDAETFNNLGLAYRDKGDTASALGVFGLALKSNPRLVESHLNMGDIYRTSRKSGEAETAYLQAITIDSTYGPAFNNLGLLYVDAGRRDRAEETLQIGTRNAPQYPYCWLNLGALYLETNRPQLAIEPLQRFLQQRPQQLEARFNLAMAFVRTDRLAEARKVLDEILALKPDHARAHALLEQIMNQGK